LGRATAIGLVGGLLSASLPRLRVRLVRLPASPSADEKLSDFPGLEERLSLDNLNFWTVLLKPFRLERDDFEAVWPEDFVDFEEVSFPILNHRKVFNKTSKTMPKIILL
jgi:hypothetical protein